MESEKLKSNDFGLLENHNSDEDGAENDIHISKPFGLVSGYSGQEDEVDEAHDRNSESVLSSGNTEISSNVNDNMLECNKETAGNKAVELLPDSGIYIHKTSLKEAKITSSSQTLSARK
ncbi:uncharacterized protein LOC117178908 [Belonocnema kinseyi]|uniref:uncharacterized protein LOC117178908 n=1 Tax=Belonocnema kinseyi TaxID=2817044 RepID=UPI00143D0CBE|nr:uncharacterized protein LOC117178908 [Belonocnema kinseyi]